MRTLVKGAFLHDVGKIGTPDQILLKPGKLNDVEFAEMKRHVIHGREIVAGSSWLQDADAVVGNHNEKFDGSGYHEGLSGAAIPIAARIFAIADRALYLDSDSRTMLAIGPPTELLRESLQSQQRTVGR